MFWAYSSVSTTLEAVSCSVGIFDCLLLESLYLLLFFLLQANEGNYKVPSTS
jgi:hypothetical protein